MTLPVLRTIEELRARRRDLVDVAFVPTMGALHRGHSSLIEQAATDHREVILSVFVNPLQFGSATDLLHYPRRLEADARLAEEAGATYLFAPSEEAMFPSGPPMVTVDPGPLGALLEGSSRPGHMAGVATIVTRLFGLVQPQVAYFGEKDFEQLTLIRRLVVDLGLGIEIVGMPIVREADGLALSSRNLRLDAIERSQATVLSRALRVGAAAVAQGCNSLAELEAVMAGVVAGESGVALDYATAREESTFALPSSFEAPLRLLIAATVGPVRLIDNVAVHR